LITNKCGKVATLSFPICPFHHAYLNKWGGNLGAVPWCCVIRTTSNYETESTKLILWGSFTVIGC